MFNDLTVHDFLVSVYCLRGFLRCFSEASDANIVFRLLQDGSTIANILIDFSDFVINYFPVLYCIGNGCFVYCLLDVTSCPVLLIVTI